MAYVTVEVPFKTRDNKKGYPTSGLCRRTVGSRIRREISSLF